MKKMLTVRGPNGENVEVEVDENLVFGAEDDSAPVPLVISGELFYAVAVLPGDDYLKLTGLLSAMPNLKNPGADEIAKMVSLSLEMAELFLMTESVERLAARLKSKERPVSIERLMEVIGKLVQDQYAPSQEADSDRPTKRPSDSSGGSDSDGGGSEGPSLAEESTSTD